MTRAVDWDRGCTGHRVILPQEVHACLRQIMHLPLFSIIPCVCDLYLKLEVVRVTQPTDGNTVKCM